MLLRRCKFGRHQFNLDEGSVDELLLVVAPRRPILLRSTRFKTFPKGVLHSLVPCVTFL